MKTILEPMEQTFMCLSCLQYLTGSDNLTLICGHAICKNVSFRNVSDFYVRAYLVLWQTQRPPQQGLARALRRLQDPDPE